MCLAGVQAVKEFFVLFGDDGPLLAHLGREHIVLQAEGLVQESEILHLLIGLDLARTSGLQQ